MGGCIYGRACTPVCVSICVSVAMTTMHGGRPDGLGGGGVYL